MISSGSLLGELCALCGSLRQAATRLRSQKEGTPPGLGMTPQRLGKAKPEEDIKPGRTPFHRGYDRLVFSSPFRRLKDKTQVFSLATDDATSLLNEIAEIAKSDY